VAEPAKQYHLIGIGGAGMSALASVLLARGFSVTGSDIAESPVIDRLRSLGAVVHIGHSPDNLQDAEVIVRSAAIPEHNCELSLARKRGLPVLSRGELLGELFAEHTMIAIAGSHGKTSTTAMLGQLLIAAGLDPTVLVGGEVKAFGGNCRLGKSDLVVIEACEYDGFFLHLQPTCTVVLNVELEHTDQYPTLSAATEAFNSFVHKLRPGGYGVFCLDNPVAARLARQAPGKVITYSLHRSADFTAEALEVVEGGSRFKVLKKGEPLGETRLPMIGEHMVSNALAVLACCEALGLELEPLLGLLEHLERPGRRFEVEGEAGGVTVVNDYAHHPSELAATLKAARQWYDKPLLVIFQPHLYTRTRDLVRDFARALSLADRVIVTDIFSAREEPLPKVTGELVVEAIRALDSDCKAHFVHTPGEAVALASDLLEPGWLALVLGAGDVVKAAPLLLQRLAHKVTV